MPYAIAIDFYVSIILMSPLRCRHATLFIFFHYCRYFDLIRLMPPDA